MGALSRRRREWQHHGPLSTVVDLTLTGGARATRRAHAFAMGEIERLEGEFSAYDADSHMSRWVSGRLADDDTTDEFRRLLVLASVWQRATGGVFNPCVGRAVRRWHVAESDNELPSPHELEALARGFARPAYDVAVTDGGTLSIDTIGDLDGFQLNALAKGHIVDLVFDAVSARFDLDAVVLSIGGDVRVGAKRDVRCAIEDPLRQSSGSGGSGGSGASHRAFVSIKDGAVATSGGSRRFVRVAGKRYSHLIDPRTARPVDHVASATVVANDAATADVLATVMTIVSADEAVALADEQNVACLVVGTDGSSVRNSAFERVICPDA